MLATTAIISYYFGRTGVIIALLVAALPVIYIHGIWLVTTHGFSTSVVGRTYERGLQLSRRLGDRKHSFSLLSGVFVFHIVRGQLEESRRLAQECVGEASRDDGPAVEMAGRFLLGTSLFHLGQLAPSLEQLELAVPDYGGTSHPALAFFVGRDVRIFCHAYLSHLFWQLGHAEEAAARSEEAIALARALSNPFSLAVALDYAAMLDVFRQDSEHALARSAEASAVCRKHGFAYYLAWADTIAGWATAVEGDTAAGLVQLRNGLDAFKAAGVELRLPFYYGLLAEVCGLAGQVGEALANIASGFAFQSKNGELWFASELHRIQGDVLLRSGAASEAQISYQRAIESAQQMGAPMLERRAADRLREMRTAGDVRRKAAER